MCPGRSDDGLVCGVHQPSLAHPATFWDLRCGMEAGKCSAKAQTLQLPAQRIQSTAVWLRERQIGRAPQPATEVSWDICFSCKLAYVRDVIRGLKLKPKVNAQFLEQSSSIPVLSFNTASCRLLGHKRNFLRAEKSEVSASKILEGNLF